MRTGDSAHVLTAGRWEPDESRGSSPVLREPGGAIPPGYSPCRPLRDEAHARRLRAAVAERFGALGLELHPEKTKIVYCKDANRRGNFEHTSFDFLGYTFRARLARGSRGYFGSFSPAISNGARKAVGQQIRAWHLNRCGGSDLSDLAEAINPQIRGWINYCVSRGHARWDRRAVGSMI